MNNGNEYPTLAVYPKTTLYRHAKKSLDETVYDRRKQNKGRRKKVITEMSMSLKDKF